MGSHKLLTNKNNHYRKQFVSVLYDSIYLTHDITIPHFLYEIAYFESKLYHEYLLMVCSYMSKPINNSDILLQTHDQQAMLHASVGKPLNHKEKDATGTV